MSKYESWATSARHEVATDEELAAVLKYIRAKANRHRMGKSNADKLLNAVADQLEQKCHRK